MITKIFDTGTSRGESPVNYLLGDTDHTGKTRSVKPRLILGNANTTIDLINSIDRKFKYTSGVLSFRHEEKPTHKQQLEIIDDFRKSFMPGLNAKENFNDLWVLHKDKGYYELHFLVVREELTSNKSFNIAPPGKRKDEHFKAWSNSINQKNGWFQVIGDPFKAQLAGFETKSPKKDSPEFQENKIRQSAFINKIKKNILNEKVKNRDHLIYFLTENKYEITRVGANYISVVLPGTDKAKRFKGPMFSDGVDYKDLIEQYQQSKIPQMLTSQASKLNNDVLNGFIADRLAFNTQAYLTTKKSFRRPKKVSVAQKVKELKEYLKTNESLSEKIFNKPAEHKATLKSNIKKIRNNAAGGNTVKSSFSNVVSIEIQIGSLVGQLINLRARINSELDSAKKFELMAKAAELEQQIKKLNTDLVEAKNRQYQEETKKKFKI